MKKEQLKRANEIAEAIDQIDTELKAVQSRIENYDKISEPVSISITGINGFNDHKLISGFLQMTPACMLDIYGHNLIDEKQALETELEAL